jgi:hypothetical protein
MDFLKAVTGIKPATLTAMLTRIFVGGHYIRPHSDCRSDRDVCAVFYASPEWQPTFGGRFRHLGPGPDIVPVEPRPNRLLPAAGRLHARCGADQRGWRPVAALGLHAMVRYAACRGLATSLTLPGGARLFSLRKPMAPAALSFRSADEEHFGLLQRDGVALRRHVL